MSACLVVVGVLLAALGSPAAASSPTSGSRVPSRGVPGGTTVWVPIASSGYDAAGSRTLVLRRTGTRVSAAQVAVFVDTGGSISTSCGSGVNLSARVLISWDSGAGSESFRLVNRRLEAASGAQRTTYARTSYAKRAASVGISAEALRRAAAKCL